MKRIKSIILSAAVLMAAIMAGNVSRAASQEGIQTLIMKGGGLTEMGENESGNLVGKLVCPIVNLGGGEQGTSTLVFESRFFIDEDGNEQEEIINATYTYKRDSGEVVEGDGDGIKVVEFTSFKNDGDTKYLVRCKCEGTVKGTWNGATVNHLSCDCLIEVDEVAGTMTCKACRAQLS